MATTETRTGFRLPWSTEHRAPDSTTAADTAAALDATDAGADAGIEPVAVAAEAADTAAGTEETEASTDAPVEAHAADADPTSASPTSRAEITDTPMQDTSAAPTAPRVPTASPKRPTKFLADLTNAMRAAAETERAEILERFRAEAKAFVEQVQERSGGAAADLRKQTDDDIAGIRDWSKAEIARIREETDERIAHRKSRLDRDLEAHAARIEREIEQVNATVEGFEASMSRFFEGLLTEDDPTSFAERAANLPEPPSLEDIVVATAGFAPPPVAATDAVSEPAPPEPVAATAVGTPETADLGSDHESEPAVAEAPEPEPSHTVEDAVADHETEPFQDPEPASEALDPRVEALGLSPDFAAAAEEEAFRNVGGENDDDGSGEEIPALDDETIAARLAGLPQATPDPSTDAASTQVVVTGLVSVASIAGFKRHLGRLPGVRSVGVSSGPEGEFLFTVTHGGEAALHDAIPTLPGFAARVSKSGEGVLHVAARDPESDA